ncbi:MAG TPA: branched-chain amino acid ABC transporter permease [Chloroflexota bacterium]|nr:branched-chain amino acid ABC transporter permease [Chloroflexota bacterium]
MNQIFLQALNGLMVGSSLALVASGLALQFGVMDIINFAQGDFYMVGGYVLWLTMSRTNNFVLSVIAATVIVGVLGGGLLMAMAMPLLEKAQVLVLLATLGLSLILEQLATNIWGGTTQLVPPPLVGTVVHIGSFIYPIYDLIIIGSAAVVLLLSFLGLQFTKYGVWLRGVAQNRGMAAALGVPVTRVYVVAFVVSIGLAALAGALLTPITSVYPTVGGDVILNAFIIVVAGGLGNFKGAAAISVLIGEVISLGSIWVNPVAVQIALFGLVIVLLIARTRRGAGSVARI